MAALKVDAVSKLANLLPTGTILTFQAVVPVFTNNGECGHNEKIMTGILLFVFTVVCWVLNFTDSITTENGSVYYGLVTTKGLYNPQFREANIEGVEPNTYFYNDEQQRYTVRMFDYLNGVCNVITLGALTLFAPQITSCFYPRISDTIVKTVPILVSFVMLMYFAVAPPPRRGLGFSLPKGSVKVVPNHSSSSV